MVTINYRFYDGHYEHIILRANAKGKPENITYERNGIVYLAMQLEGKIYIPDKNVNS